MSTKTTSKSLCRRVETYASMLPDYRCDRVGKLQIKTGTEGPEIIVRSWRDAIMGGGGPPCRLRWPGKRKIYQLLDDDRGIWMTTCLQEIAQMDKAICAAKGKVLVGGLGLGICSWLMATRYVSTSICESVTTVEINDDLIKLIYPIVKKCVDVEHADLFEYLKTCPDDYDFAFFDIWQSTGEWSWQTQVVPLRRLAFRKSAKIMCWAEEQMRGQVLNMLFRVIDISPDVYFGRAHGQHYWVFQQAAKIAGLLNKSRIDETADLGKVVKIENENRTNPKLKALINLYLNKVGSPKWEKTFGKFWDESEQWLTKDDN